MEKMTDIRTFDYESEVNQLLENVLSLDSDGVQTIQIDYDIINAAVFHGIKCVVANNAVCNLCNVACDVACNTCLVCNHMMYT